MLTDDLRAKFEAHFFRTKEFAPHLWSWSEEYSDDAVQALWESWQEAYRLGLLRAAEVCDDLSTGIAHEYAGNCADAIRAEVNDSKTP